MQDQLAVPPDPARRMGAVREEQKTELDNEILQLAQAQTPQTDPSGRRPDPSPPLSSLPPPVLSSPAPESPGIIRIQLRGPPRLRSV